jgi:hypothetical protein
LHDIFHLFLSNPDFTFRHHLTAARETAAAMKLIPLWRAKRVEDGRSRRKRHWP